MSNQDSNSGVLAFSPESLTPQEKEVFLRCRRTHMLKGAVYVGLYCGMVYWFRAQGRGFSFINKFPIQTYGLGSFVAFGFGFKNYGKCSYQGLMNLDNSPMAEQIRKYKNMSPAERKSVRIVRPPQASGSPGQQPSQAKPVQQHSQLSPPVQGRTPNFKDGPAINQHSYNRERSMLDSSPKEFDKNDGPDAFGMSSTQPAFPNNQPEDDQPTKGKTFDDIREGNRRRQQQSNSNYPSNQPHSNNLSGNTGGTKRKRYNEYGDEIED